MLYALVGLLQLPFVAFLGVLQIYALALVAVEEVGCAGKEFALHGSVIAEALAR